MLAVAVALQVVLSTSVLADICKLNNGMTDEVRKAFLDVHNNRRSEVARGVAEDKLGGFAPKAAKMWKMNYDCKIEESIMEWVSKCDYGHSRKEGYGENIWASSDNHVDLKKAAESSSNMWFAELEERGVGEELKFTEQLFKRIVAHYTQVVWQDSTRLGCAVKWCDTVTFAACQYQTPGNVFGQNVYEKGEPCSKCDCEKCQCSTGNGLCLNSSITYYFGSSSMDGSPGNGDDAKSTVGAEGETEGEDGQEKTTTTSSSRSLGSRKLQHILFLVLVVINLHSINVIT
uniref:SCP domain-containing protein n=1 Tax=Haemonchus contortus TaxID=6289 RepID=A0A7I4YUL1_HAECO